MTFPLAASPQLPSGGRAVFQDLFDGAASHLSLIGLSSEHLTLVPGESEMTATALQADVDQQGDTPWAFRLYAAMPAAVAAGDVVHVRFWARNVFSNTGSARLAVILEQSAQPHAKLLDLPVTVGTLWQCVDLPVSTTQSYAANEWQLSIRLGYMPQVVQFARLEVIHFGHLVTIEELPRLRVGYVGREATADWRLAAAERIERHRKGELELTVTDALGRPVPGASVHAVQRRHEFGFGTCVSLALLRDGPDAERYRSTLCELFNHAVIENELKWPPIEANGYDNPDRLIAWLNQRQIPTRGHCLIWPSRERMPEIAAEAADDPPRLRRLIADHITRTVQRYRGQLIDWDVVNEPYAHHFAMDVLGGNHVMAEWFQLAHAADPTCNLFINDYEILASGDMLGTPHQEHFYRTVGELLEAGAPLHGIGMQGHFGGNITSPHNLLKILDRFASLGMRIKVTEMDIQIADPTLQADYYRDFLTVLLSHPAVDAIMQWGFWEGSHWIPSSAIIDRRWNFRPHGQVYRDLVHGQWRTDTRMRTNEQGRCSFRGFAGDYQINFTTPDGHQGEVTTKIESGQRRGIALTSATFSENRRSR